MSVVEVKAKIVIDNTGVSYEIPVLLTPFGVVSTFLDYMIQSVGVKSVSFCVNASRATRLLAEYLEANRHSYSSVTDLFRGFSLRLYDGTIGEDGLDPSGLYWLPTRRKTANIYLSAVSGYLDYLADEKQVVEVNPLVEAHGYDLWMKYAAWTRRNQHDFLGHVKGRKPSEIDKKIGLIRQRRAPMSLMDDSISFPKSIFDAFFIDGVGSGRDRRCAVRDQLIILLMHGAGARESEPLHLWVHDVLDDPHQEGNCIVRLYHPEEGRSPDNWRGRTGKTNRSAYLRENYGLTPRNRIMGSRKVGWKTTLMDHKDNYIQMHWFPPEYGVLFRELWREHLHYLACLERHHPYAFISYERNTIGQPYTLNAFNDNYKKAMRRIGYSVAKAEGLTPHGHRHAYGRRITRAEVDPVIRKKALHHAQLESQAIYTVPANVEVSDALNRASRKLDEGSVLRERKPKSEDELAASGFEDIDPQGLLSGFSPKLLK